MAQNHEYRIARIAEAIKRYLEANPRAADSVEGITGWWFGEARLCPTQEEVEEALERLIGEGVVVKLSSLDGRVLYTGKR